MAYAVGVFGVLGFFVVYFGAPLLILAGPGTVSSPRHVVSLPYTVQVTLRALKARGRLSGPAPDAFSAVKRWYCRRLQTPRLVR
jgi:hypothetical protein